jgi:PAS domain S-box-containing protein
MEEVKNIFTVLVAEDDRELGILVERKLSRAGFKTLRSFNGQETLRLCSDHQDDRLFVMMDYQLGDMTAQEVVTELRNRGHEKPFIVTTGFGSEQVAVEMMKLGAEDYLVKNSQYLELIVPVLSQVLEKKSTEMALSRTQNALLAAHQAIMAAENGIVIADTSSQDCPIVYYNPAFISITGYQCAHEATLAAWLASYGEQHQHALDELREALKSRESKNVHLKRQSGQTPSWHEVSLSFIPELQENQGAFIAIFTDTTQRFHNEKQITDLRGQLEQAQRLAITGQIARELAHEIGHPITLISSKIQFMLAKEKTEPKDLSTILQHIDRITNLLRRFSSGSADQILNPMPVAVGTLIESVLELCPESESIQISIHQEENIPTLIADKSKIIQVLLNLLTNALEACREKGTIDFIMEQRSYPDKKMPFVAISVKDSGCGISEVDQKKIFEPFFSTKTGSNNSGLGLPICQTIANLHQGWMEVDSQVNQGTCMTIVLPLEPVEARQVVSH